MLCSSSRRGCNNGSITLGAWLSRKTASNAAPVDAAGKVKHVLHDMHQRTPELQLIPTTGEQGLRALALLMRSSPVIHLYSPVVVQAVHQLTTALKPLTCQMNSGE